MEKILFFSVGGIPLIILGIIFGGIFFTCRMGFINIIGFKHALAIAVGKYEDQESEGEVSPFQALATALSGSVGLGNIAGVAIAMQMAGAGTVFWMSVTAILGMASKFVECSLGLKYRQIKLDGTVSGGPMYYLAEGFSQLGWTKLGRILAILFAIFCLGNCFGGGNMFQANQSFSALATVFPFLEQYNWVFGIFMAFLVGLVIIGGISRIGVVTARLIPIMVGIYISACLLILVVKFTLIPNAIATIIQEAFTPHAVEGGFIWVLVIGIRRSAFSNNAGLGSAAIAHAVAKTKQPIREGIVSILEPFIDTVIICNLTALVILVTGVYSTIEPNNIDGSELAATAFAQVINWFPYVLAIVIFFFAFSNIITWSYYGEKCWSYLFGEPTRIIFQVIFLLFVFIGSVVNLGTVIDFSDMMLLAMAIPNLIGCLALSNQVALELKTYWHELYQAELTVKTAKRKEV